MTFTSLSFVVFVGVTFFSYYFLARGARSQMAVLVLASAVFYAWDNPKLLTLLASVCAITASTSWTLCAPVSQTLKRFAFGASILALLAILGTFKYGGLLVSSMQTIAADPGWSLFFQSIPLPIGISFYIFHSISMITDIRRGDYRPDTSQGVLAHFGRTLLYIMFFPQLIAGPIVKAKSFLPQIDQKKLGDIDWDAAFGWLTTGYFYKMVVADNLAAVTQFMKFPYVDRAGSSRLMALVLGYSCQIFSDFFGYSLIALGLAALFGYRLVTNFDRPYIATSFSDFWRRWHMSLSAWLRDYLYIPLGGSKHGKLRTYVNLFIVMFLGGLWHGAAWSYALWGTMHGAALALERPFLDSRFYRSRAPLILAARALLVFAFVSVAWLFFKFRNQSEAFAYIIDMFRNTDKSTTPQDLGSIYVYCAPVIAYHLIWVVRQEPLSQAQRNWLYAFMLLFIATNSGVPGAFIYFQF